MRKTLPGSASLIWPSRSPYTLWRQFWRRNRDLCESGHCLMTAKSNIHELCERLVSHVSPNLYWLTPEGSEPILNAALSSGLRSYDVVRTKPRARLFDTPEPKDTYGAFLDATMSHLAVTLSHARISCPNAIWMPAAGEPLQPWLETHGGKFSIRSEKPSSDDIQRVRGALEAAVLDDFDRMVLDRMASRQLAAC